MTSRQAQREGDLMITEKLIVGGFQVDRKLLDATDKFAKETDRSRSAIIRLALKEYLVRHDAYPARD